MKRKNVLKSKSDKKRSRRENGRFGTLLRYFITAAFLVAIVIIFPLSLVWKQVYITNTSLHRHALKDSLAVLQKEVTALNIKFEQLSSTRRIESIARESLELDYPLSKEIVVVRPKKQKEKGFILDSPFWAILKRSITPGKG